MKTNIIPFPGPKATTKTPTSKPKSKTKPTYKHERGMWSFTPEHTSEQSIADAQLLGLETLPDLRGFTMRQIQAAVRVREREFPVMVKVADDLMETYGYDLTMAACEQVASETSAGAWMAHVRKREQRGGAPEDYWRDVICQAMSNLTEPDDDKPKTETGVA